MKIQITPRDRKFSFAFGPATTGGVELSSQTEPTTIGKIEPVAGFENVLLYGGARVLGVDGARFPFLTDARANLASIRYMVELGAELGKPTTIEVEAPPAAELLTSTDAAARLGITASQVRRLAGEGALEGARRVGRDWLIPARTVVTYQRQSVGRPKKPA